MRDNAPSGPYTVVLNLSGSTTYPREGRSGVTYITLGMARADYQMSVKRNGELHAASNAPGSTRTWDLLG
ncbi:hypothetical protein, partial [Mycobacteroides abscessus]|uniref:hypothetical protein n=1 Tax=Mycobacteroides abscessus TaxID=36809 RepID=UPI0013FDC571